jgi:oxygen-independent coproporphyrinogen-3 oxidase
MLRAVDEAFGLAADAEVTTEANPDSVTPQSLAALRAAGFTRISFGMQSAVPHVLATLDRTHLPGRVTEAVGWARTAGFDQVSLDLIYGTPGESADDWQRSLDTAIGLAPDHVSAYALVVEEGTRLAGLVRRGVLPAPDDDVLADRYVQADETLARAGYGWYEVSNWAVDDDARCRHNLGYWRGDDWWGIGPGAHSHVGGVRWWNVKHPAAYAARLAEDRSPAQAREVLDDEQRYVERVLLGVRLAEGLPVDALDPYGRKATPDLADRGLVDAQALASGRVLLTLNGRLLADGVVRELLP